jgi:hypothetical protein
MKKKGAKVINNEIVPYLLSGCFKELTSKKHHIYVRCSFCRSTLFKKGKCLNFFIQNGHKKHCQYKKMELPDYKTHEMESDKNSYGNMRYEELREQYFDKLNRELNVYVDLEGETHESKEIDLSELKYYDRTTNFNFADQGHKPLIYKKFDGTLVIKK